MFSRLRPLVGYIPLLTRLSLCVSLRGVARHVTYLHLCLCVCVRSSPFMSLHTMLLFRGGGVLLCLQQLASTGIPFVSYVCGVRGGHGHSVTPLGRVSVCLVCVRRLGRVCVGIPFSPFAGMGMAPGYTPLVTFVRCM